MNRLLKEFGRVGDAKLLQGRELPLDLLARDPGCSQYSDVLLQQAHESTDVCHLHGAPHTPLVGVAHQIPASYAVATLVASSDLADV